MNTAIRQLATAVATVMILTPALAAQQAEERSRTQGLKETDKFIKAGGITAQSVAEANNQVKSTLAAFNALVTQPSANMKGSYKKVMKASDAMHDRVAESVVKIDAMQTAGGTYFGGRAETIKNIQDAQLQGRAQQRLEESQKQFAAVMQQLRDAGAALEPFRKQLADQITYLGSDLNPSATASLKPEVDKLNAQGAEVFANADKAIVQANAYFQSLRAQS
jgi:hypothetical protein